MELIAFKWNPGSNIKLLQCELAITRDGETANDAEIIKIFLIDVHDLLLSAMRLVKRGYLPQFSWSGNNSGMILQKDFATIEDDVTGLGIATVNLEDLIKICELWLAVKTKLRAEFPIPT